MYALKGLNMNNRVGNPQVSYLSLTPGFSPGDWYTQDSRALALNFNFKIVLIDRTLKIILIRLLLMILLLYSD